jgi:hypothetical protein
MKSDKKRAPGRPRTGKMKLMLSIDPEVVDKITEQATEHGLSRSTYIELVLREVLAGNMNARLTSWS